jgi:hypothetical protein
MDIVLYKQHRGRNVTRALAIVGSYYNPKRGESYIRAGKIIIVSTADIETQCF